MLLQSLATSGGKQRYYCKRCQLYFTLDSIKIKTPNKTSGRHQATIIDIARQVNVSKSTVSRALRGSSEINIETKNAVLKVAKELNYVPNHLASSLVKKRSYTIGIIVPEFVGNYFPQFIIAAQEVANEAGYSVLICQSNETFTSEAETRSCFLPTR
jgi:LacI family transcriptional regulator/LacI family repressor for deo operon, udp, cdd, tsx, nupC, and nupG